MTGEAVEKGGVGERPQEPARRQRTRSGSTPRPHPVQPLRRAGGGHRCWCENLDRRRKGASSQLRGFPRRLQGKRASIHPLLPTAKNLLPKQPSFQKGPLFFHPGSIEVCDQFPYSFSGLS